MMSTSERNYWSQRYVDQLTGWDIGYPSTPLKEYIDQLENKNLKILIPGAGNAYEAEYLHTVGFKYVDVLDISPIPLDWLSQRVPGFPKDQLLLGDFFEHEGQYDLIFEQTFFCSFIPSYENRSKYARHMAQLLRVGGKLVGVWFEVPLVLDTDKRPFGGDRDLYWSYLSPHFNKIVFEDCYNSIKPRAGTELFGIFEKK